MQTILAFGMLALAIGNLLVTWRIGKLEGRVKRLENRRHWYPKIEPGEL